MAEGLGLVWLMALSPLTDPPPSLIDIEDGPVTFAMSEYLPPAKVSAPYPLGRAWLIFPDGTPDTEGRAVPVTLTLTFAYGVDLSSVSGTCRAEARLWSCRLKDGWGGRMTIQAGLSGLKVDFPSPVRLMEDRQRWWSSRHPYDDDFYAHWIEGGMSMRHSPAF
ncbi:hypothetical protein [Asticcacaulis sp. YBE204]|uniref:hypothetical protein n=1 Tax=Asticcacaulis sp. YBE204 TaxID=1282363 RepID=UPI0003C3B3F0|nr:hypothetical protein [Asticcacaulis sp. YBE204]ESQ76906.1 hypothetical protein AEYBE204_18695 [Asticcacaulis sp. YBE204]